MIFLVIFLLFKKFCVDTADYEQGLTLIKINKYIWISVATMI